MTELRGADVVSAITTEIREQLAQMQVVPCLAVVRVGERGDDIAYERGAIKRMEKLGLNCKSFVFRSDISDAEFKSEFANINADRSIHGILLLRPLPHHIDEKGICDMIDPHKDIDCIGPANIEKVFVGDDTGFLPCTAAAVVKCLEFAGVELTGKRAVVVGRSLVVGKPVSMLLLGKNATVTICHSRTENLQEECSRADILIACVGKAKLIDKDYIKPGAVVIDVGINVDQNGKLCGDVNYEAAAPISSIITPVPGGVGSVTTAILAQQLVKAAKMQALQ